MMGHRRRGCHPGDWNSALALTKRASGHDDAVVATCASSSAKDSKISFHSSIVCSSESAGSMLRVA